LCSTGGEGRGEGYDLRRGGGGRGEEEEMVDIEGVP